MLLGLWKDRLSDFDVNTPLPASLACINAFFSDLIIPLCNVLHVHIPRFLLLTFFDTTYKILLLLSLLSMLNLYILDSM